LKSLVVSKLCPGQDICNGPTTSSCSWLQYTHKTSFAGGIKITRYKKQQDILKFLHTLITIWQDQFKYNVTVFALNNQNNII
jgi:hypothetical protein